MPLLDTTLETITNGHPVPNTLPAFDLQRAIVSPLHAKIVASGDEVRIDPFLDQHLWRGLFEPSDGCRRNPIKGEPPQLECLEHSGPLIHGLPIEPRPGLRGRELVCHEEAPAKLHRSARLRQSESRVEPPATPADWALRGARGNLRGDASSASVPDVTDLLDIVRAPDERTALTEMLDYYRAVMLRKTEGLSDEQLAVTVASSDLTLGGLLMHLALVEDSWFLSTFLGGELGESWSGFDWKSDPDWEFHHAHEYSRDVIVAQYEGSIARSRQVVDEAESLDVLAAKPTRDGQAFNLRWILVHLIEEYARHAGHADLIRESIDGATGD